MAHFKCLSCRARVWRDRDPSQGAPDLCPGCGGPLETVDRAEEIIGFRALRTRPRAGRPIGDLVRDTIARNDAARTERLRSTNGDERPNNA